MYGHTHDQEFTITKSVTNSDKNIGLGQVGPSVTTDTWENPAYALIDIDEETMLPINFRIFAMDLIEANASNEPQWVQLIDYVNDYGITPGMSPDSLYDLAYRMTQDVDLFWKFSWDMTRDSNDMYVGTDEEWKYYSWEAYCEHTSSYGT